MELANETAKAIYEVLGRLRDAVENVPGALTAQSIADLAMSGEDFDALVEAASEVLESAEVTEFLDAVFEMEEDSNAEA